MKFLTYKGTMQEVCLRLMGKKMLVALMMEGKFSGEGLQSLDADEDLMSAMARELVEKAGVGESADKIWRQLERERSKHVEPESVVVDNLLPADEPERSRGDKAKPQGASGIHVVPSTERSKRNDAPPWPSTGPTEAPVQLSLFG